MVSCIERLPLPDTNPRWHDERSDVEYTLSECNCMLSEYQRVKKSSVSVFFKGVLLRRMNIQVKKVASTFNMSILPVIIPV